MKVLNVYGGKFCVTLDFWVDNITIGIYIQNCIPFCSQDWKTEELAKVTVSLVCGDVIGAHLAKFQYNISWIKADRINYSMTFSS